MKKIVAITASLLVNLSLVLAFEQIAEEAFPVLNGEVLISYAAEQPVAALAEASADDHRAVAL